MNNHLKNAYCVALDDALQEAGHALMPITIIKIVDDMLANSSLQSYLKDADRYRKLHTRWSGTPMRAAIRVVEINSFGDEKNISGRELDSELDLHD